MWHITLAQFVKDGQSHLCIEHHLCLRVFAVSGSSLGTTSQLSVFAQCCTVLYDVLAVQ